jgi:hypothetical protein
MMRLDGGGGWGFESLVMADLSKDEIVAELEAIKLSIQSLEQFVVPAIDESEARRRVERLIALLQLANL